jgi:ATP-dependent helicase HrpA
MTSTLAGLTALLDSCMRSDRFLLSQRIKKISAQARVEPKQLEALTQAINDSVIRCQSRLNNSPLIIFPEQLPVSQHREQIATAINDHQVVILCGETGSGKTTQLAKICLQLGRGGRGLIGHTQPRRLAARSVAMRIAEELNSELGQLVGFKVRFSDRTRPDTRIKLMTDGILLAELQQDRFLERYDTLIIDEAHERSLNIDFLLGYLKRLLPKRPDLKVIITSATINAEKFSTHFSGAPVINVSGRGYPIEIRYQASDAVDDDSRDSQQQVRILHAVDELARHGPGDILIFLPGEREIRETAEALRKHHPVSTEILPLFARLGTAEQQKIFKSHSGRRIVLATNVAETSLTVPGIHYVIDTGVVRLSRYSYRSKIQRLPIEKVSQASANQRAGRCGRTGPGICIRLYSEDDFSQRPAFTDPEILRSNLAGVILQMKASNLGEVEDFPFIDPPDGRFIRAGYHLLEELGAIDAAGTLTQTGRQLARLPVDLRLGRIIIAAVEEQCLTEVLIIAAALTIQDPRERPVASRQAADEAHRRFNDKRSDFIAYLNLWREYEQQLHHLSQNKLRHYCREHFLSFVRLREWRDIYTQLLTLVKGMGLTLNQQAADYDAIHRSLLSGFISHIARLHEGREYLGPRNARPLIFPGSVLVKSTPKWIVSAELVETSQLFARTVARIDPVWIEKAAPHLLRREYYDPHWSKSRGQVVAYERLRIYGLVINEKRPVNYGRIAPDEAREFFIRGAMVEGEYTTQAHFMLHNRSLLNELVEQEHKARRRDHTIDESWLYEFYDQRIAAGIVDIRSFEKWYRTQVKQDPNILCIETDQFAATAVSDPANKDFPDQLVINNLALSLRYHFAPGADDDGVSVDLPLALLGQFNSNDFDWLVPGLLEDKLIALIRCLPKSLRRHCVPATNFARACLQAMPEHKGALLDRLAQQLKRMTGIDIDQEAWRLELLPEHLLMYYRVIAADNTIVGQGRSLAQLQQQFSASSQAVFKQLPFHEFEHDKISAWNFGELPENLTINVDGLTLTGYPAIVADADGIHVRVLDSADRATLETRTGLRQLATTCQGQKVKWIKKNVPGRQRLCLNYATLGSCDEMIAEVIGVIMDDLLKEQGSFPRTAAAFDGALARVGRSIVEQTFMLFSTIDQALERRKQINKRLKSLTAPPLLLSLADMRQQLDHLVYRGFISKTPLICLLQLPRYLQAIELRLDKLQRNPARDLQLYRELQPLLPCIVESSGKNILSVEQPVDMDPRWLLEELRVSLFAQELGTQVPVSLHKLKMHLGL